MEDYIPGTPPRTQSIPPTKKVPDTPQTGIPLFDFLSRIDGHGDLGKGWHGKCPCHEDKKDSFSITITNENVVLVNCFVCGNMTQPGLKARGLWPILVPHEEKLKAHLKEDKFHFEWVQQTDSNPPEPIPVTGHALHSVYDYKGVNGEYLGRVIRYDALSDPVPGSKRSKQFRPQFYFMGHTGPMWMFRMPQKRPLYGLPSLIGNSTILLVEGEKTADRAQALFPELAVVSPMGGLQGLASCDLTLLRNRNVIIWPDADTEWKQHMKGWQNVLMAAQCLTLSCIDLPERLVRENNKWDLADPVPAWFNIHSAFDTLITFTVSNRDPIGSILKAEDLKVRYVHVIEAGHSNSFVHLETGHEMTVAVFDATFRNLTVRRDLGLPSNYFLNASDRTATLSGTKYFPNKPRIVKHDDVSYYNSYIPPIIEPIQGDVQPFIDHVYWMLSKEDGDELMVRFANMVQRPERRPRSAYILQGIQGLGKNLLFEALKPLVGESNFHITDPASILGSWNYFLAGKVMLVLNEMTDYERHEMYDILKPMIADNDIEMKKKYKPEITFTNFAHIFAMTNYERPIRLPDANERRFYIAQALPQAPKDFIYYKSLHNWLHRNSAQILHFLQNYPLDKWEPEARPKMTEAKEKVALLSKDAGKVRLDQLVKDNYFHYQVYAEHEMMRILFDEGVLFKERQFNKATEMLSALGYKRFLARQKGNTGPTKPFWVTRGTEAFSGLVDNSVYACYAKERNTASDSF